MHNTCNTPENSILQKPVKAHPNLLLASNQIQLLLLRNQFQKLAVCFRFGFWPEGKAKAETKQGLSTSFLLQDGLLYAQLASFEDMISNREMPYLDHKLFVLWLLIATFCSLLFA
jgi:hypothetical protein